jgi:hypothetical protein
LLAENPRLGRLRPEIAPDARAWIVGRYLVLYRAQDGGIEVVRVVHGAREIERSSSERIRHLPHIDPTAAHDAQQYAAVEREVVLCEPPTRRQPRSPYSGSGGARFFCM